MRNAILLFLFALGACAPHPFSWAVYYGGANPPETFWNYDLVILDPKYPFAFDSLKKEGKTVVGYISLGEVMEIDPWHARMKEAGLLLSENSVWKGSHTVDVRNQEWKRTVLEEIIPAILAKGFDGLMMDTIDSPIEAERAHPDKYPAMKAASIDLVQSIRNRYPNITLVLNRGYAILPQVAPALDYLIAESTFTHYDHAAKAPRLSDAVQQAQLLQMIAAGRAAAPKLKVLALEYWEPLDSPEVKVLYKNIRNFGFYPYISTVRLDSVHPEP